MHSKVCDINVTKPEMGCRRRRRHRHQWVARHNHACGMWSNTILPAIDAKIAKNIHWKLPVIEMDRSKRYRATFIFWLVGVQTITNSQHLFSVRTHRGVRCIWHAV